MAQLSPHVARGRDHVGRGAARRGRALASLPLPRRGADLDAAGARARGIALSPRLGVLLLAALGLAPSLHAQQRRPLAGTVMTAADSTRLEGVVVQQVGGGATTLTDASGRF